MGNPQTESEVWFDEYLLTNGYSFDPDFDFGVRTDPDRLIGRAGIEAVCEVKEFMTDAMKRRWPNGGRQIGSFSNQEWFLGVRRAISEAARQLEPLADRGWPLVIVLANPRGFNVPLDAGELIQAMYGELQVSFEIDTETGIPIDEPHWTLGKGGRLADDEAPWVSGVAALRRGDRQVDWDRDWIQRWKDEHNWEGAHTELTALLEKARVDEGAPSGAYFYVHLVETVSEEAVPVPREIFDGDNDGRWWFDPNTSTYGRISA